MNEVNGKLVQELTNKQGLEFVQNKNNSCQFCFEGKLITVKWQGSARATLATLLEKIEKI